MSSVWKLVTKVEMVAMRRAYLARSISGVGGLQTAGKLT
jgi:hypothetical protein